MGTYITLDGLTAAQLRRVADFKEKIEKLEEKMENFVASFMPLDPWISQVETGPWLAPRSKSQGKRRRKRRLSAAGRAAIVRAAKRRWKKARKGKASR